MSDIALKNFFLFLLKLLTMNKLLRDELFNSLVAMDVYQCEKAYDNAMLDIYGGK